MRCQEKECTLIGTAFGWCVFHIPQKYEERPKVETCSICGSVVSGKDLHWDHDHSNQKFRGWLCQKCNVGLGMFRDDPALLKLAAKYLESQ